MKRDTECFKSFSNMVEAYHEIILEEGINYKMFKTGEVYIVGNGLDYIEEQMDIYYDAWMAALTVRKL